MIVWLLRNFFADVPISLERAARIDGCSRLGTLFRITIPAARPGIAAAAILILIGTWNEFLFAVMLSDRNAVTVTRLIGFLDSPFHKGIGGVRPVAMDRTLRVIDEALQAVGASVVLPCDGGLRLT